MTDRLFTAIDALARVGSLNPAASDYLRTEHAKDVADAHARISELEAERDRLLAERTWSGAS